MLHVICRVLLPSNVVLDAVEEAEPVQGHSCTRQSCISHKGLVLVHIGAHSADFQPVLKGSNHDCKLAVTLSEQKPKL